MRLPALPLSVVRSAARPLAAAFVLGAATFFSVAAAAEPERCPRMVAHLPGEAGPGQVQWGSLSPMLAPDLAALGRTTGRTTLPLLRASADARAGDQAGAGEGAGLVSLTFIGHASFLIESPAGVSIVTDFNDYVRPRALPDVATMNHAHDTHYTETPDAGIRYVLRGWNPQGGPARHDLTLEDVWIRNVPTNIRRGAGTDYDGNSMFVFEVAGLCIAHLGHLHHLLTQDHLEALGRIDVVLAPVDGSYTLDLEGMLETLKAINAPVVIPMHYFSRYGLDRFLNRLGREFTVEHAGTRTVTLSRATLPKARTILVLDGG